MKEQKYSMTFLSKSTGSITNRYINAVISHEFYW